MKTNHFSKPVKIAGLLLLCLSLTVSCSKDDPDPVNEEEVITRVTLVFTAMGGIEDTYVYNVDEAPPVITLNEGLDYEVSISFEDASDPENVENITEEVIEEADDHFIFYQVNDISLEIESTDMDIEDTDGNAIGLSTLWSALGSGDTAVTIYLIHEPTSKTGTVRDDFGGEDDVQVTFSVTINP